MSNNTDTHIPPLPLAGGRQDADAPSPLPLAGGRQDADAPSPLPPAGGVGGGQFKPRNTERARELRSQTPPAERLLWRALSNRKLDGHKFSRQMPMGPYFADFLCRAAGLVVEIDGYSHDMRQDFDRRRDSFMAELRLTVLRFTNEEVMSNLEGVVQTIANWLSENGPPPTPPASGRGDDGEAQKLLGISLEGSVG